MAIEGITPGPWKVDGGVGKRGERYVWSDLNEPRGILGTHEMCVAIVQPFAAKDILANARLIAKAPQLYERCERLYSYLASIRDLGAVTGPTIDQEIQELGKLIGKTPKKTEATQ